ncbi:MAG: transcription elongation factor GreB [Pedosphaera sp.]|nr:transcription elongation factor GreB [Pedosphaera sp.]
MSKAFTREDDGVPDLPVRLRRASTLPAGARNYMTAGGVRRLREELERLLRDERPQLAAAALDAEAKAQLQQLDERILQLQDSLQSAVVPPATSPNGVVAFGTTINVREGTGEEACYRIVGVDEVDFDRGWVSWLSPLAKALEGARVGQCVRFKVPAGDQELTILSVTRDE